jgi:cation diffusion facilitator family transporter
MATADEYTVKRARHVTWVGFWTNAALGIGKIIAGICGRSGAMVADGIHSLSDFVTDVIVLVFVTLSHKHADADHQYGHGKYETFATMLIALALMLVGVMIFFDAANKVLLTIQGVQLPRPEWIALVMAIASIGVKELLFRYTRFWGQKIGSGAVIANAWHHRSDALSSIATLVGVGGAMWLGDGWQVLDPVAAMIVSVFIIMVAFHVGLPSVHELLEESLPIDLCNGIWDIIRETEGVKAFHHFRSRRNGNRIILDLHIKVDPNISVVQGHDIADNMERRLHEAYGQNMIINVHVEPYKDEVVDIHGACVD